jgi:hypothetical protein
MPAVRTLNSHSESLQEHYRGDGMKLRFYGSYLAADYRYLGVRFGSPYLAVCAVKRIDERILVAFVTAIETGKVFLDNHFK